MDLRNIDPNWVDLELDQHRYLIVKNDELLQGSLAARAEYHTCLQNTKLHAPAEKFHYRVLSEEPWRKLTIGASNGVGESYAQNLQTIYLAEGYPRYPALGALFKSMITVRNRLMRLDADFGLPARTRSILERVPRSPLSTGRRLHVPAQRHLFPKKAGKQTFLPTRGFALPKGYRFSSRAEASSPTAKIRR